jgi:nitroimidazol reductase NimA-like FMN-containing flavoprotein (pyridoxamine 5'-phosphate oxidase superfamily)
MIKDLEKKDCLKLLSENYIGHLGFISHSAPYVVPVTYFYDAEHHSLISYSGEGHKIEGMRKNPMVSMVVDEIKTVNHWRTVSVQGEFEELSGLDAKYLLHEFAEGVKRNILIKEKESHRFIGEFSSKISTQGNPIVYRIKISGITGKFRDG